MYFNRLLQLGRSFKLRTTGVTPSFNKPIFLEATGYQSDECEGFYSIFFTGR